MTARRKIPESTSAWDVLVLTLRKIITVTNIYKSHYLRMTSFKKITRFLHLWLGLGAGLVVLVVALTGSIMVFQDELEPVLFSKTLKVEPGTEKLPLDSLLKLAKKEFPKKKINQAKIFYEKSRSLIVTFGKKEEDGDMKMVFIDPYTGRVLGKGDYNHQFFLVVKN